MGADCHMLLQKKIKDEWVDIKILDIDRNYTLFGILAEVRDSRYKSIDSPRGLPKDFVIKDDYHPTCLDTPAYSDSLKGFYMGEHSYSHMTLHELHKYPWEKVHKKEGYEVLPQDLKDAILFCVNLKAYRVVFGFDS